MRESGALGFSRGIRGRVGVAPSTVSGEPTSNQSTGTRGLREGLAKATTREPEAASGLHAANWARQRALGITAIPSNDFSLYDYVLDTAVMVGAIPEAYGWRGGSIALGTYFAMARGSGGRDHDDACGHGHGGVQALEMTK